MTKRWTKTAAFAAFGGVAKNVRWSWSARSPDGKTVALTLWDDGFERTAKPVIHSCFKGKHEDWAAPET